MPAKHQSNTPQGLQGHQHSAMLCSEHADAGADALSMQPLHDVSLTTLPQWLHYTGSLPQSERCGLQARQLHARHQTVLSDQFPTVAPLTRRAQAIILIINCCNAAVFTRTQLSTLQTQSTESCAMQEPWPCLQVKQLLAAAAVPAAAAAAGAVGDAPAAAERAAGPEVFPAAAAAGLL